MFQSRYQTMFLWTVAGSVAVAAAISHGQETGFVVRDRISEAWSRVESQATTTAGASGQALVHVAKTPDGQDLPDANSVAVSVLEVRPVARATAAQYVSAPNDYSWQETAEGAAQPDFENEPAADFFGQANRLTVSNGLAFQGEGAGVEVWSGGQFRPATYYGTVQTGDHVFSNTHFFDGMHGPGAAPPFGFTSAWQKSGAVPETDAFGRPTQCNEWQYQCGCDCCNEPMGLDMFKRRPYGTLRGNGGCCDWQGRGCGNRNCGKGGCQTSDYGCGNGQCTGAERSGLLGSRRNVVEVIDN